MLMEPDNKGRMNMRNCYAEHIARCAGGGGVWRCCVGASQSTSPCVQKCELNRSYGVLSGKLAWCFPGVASRRS